MSTIVYQNLASCFETQFKETATTIKLKFAATPPTPANLVDMNTSLEYGNWGLLQTYPKEPVQKSFYTQYPSSFSRLSAKSLELCTENLGSESGNDVITDSGSDVSIFSSCLSFSRSNLIKNSSACLRVELERPKREVKSSKAPHQAEKITTNKSKNFPPPLTTMCSLQMCRRREGGRLIIDAEEAPFRNSYLQAERSDGRLKLCFLTGSDSAVTTTSASSVIKEEEENENECRGELAGQGEIDELQGQMESEKEVFEGEMNHETGLEKLQRLSRCKEGGQCSVWKPAFCLAT